MLPFTVASTQNGTASMSKPLTLWGRRSAFNVQKVLWLIDEIGLEHRQLDAGGDFGGLDTPEFLALNPHGRVPVIDDQGTIVWESHTILRYLAARHAPDRFWDADPAVRSLADRWTDWAQATLQPAFFAVFRGYFRTPEDQRDWPAIRQAQEQANRLYHLLDRHLADRPYLAGDRFTLADIPAGATLFRYFSLDLDRPSFPNVEAWYERLSDRPAYRTHVKLPFDELKGRLDF